MALEQLEMESGLNKRDFAIQLLQTWEPKEGYYFADSGGKDSAATRDILIKAGVKFDAHYCVSPVDPPQIREFLKQYHPDTQWDYHARGFWKMVVKKGLPMRTSRWCCRVIKEGGGDGRVVVLGNRRAESTNRKRQCYVETPEQRNDGKHRKSNQTLIRPIANFDNYDIWQYIRENNVPYCSLYDEGAVRKGYGEGLFKRLGCILCPFARNIELETIYFPEIVKLWRLACGHIVERHRAHNYLTGKGLPMKHHFETGEDLYQWWISRV